MHRAMIYLSGAVRFELPNIGFMLTKRSGDKPPPGRIWAADNGRFTAPQNYSDDEYLEWLAGFDPFNCLFATAPDVVGDHRETMILSAPMLPKIRDLGYKAAFVAQDGFDVAPWDEFDCLFIGGTNKFKLGDNVPDIVAEARQRGKWVHMGRVNSYKRMRLAKIIGCQSVDGTCLKFNPKKITPQLKWWLELIAAQPSLMMNERHDQ
jgi:hypothetical protein